MRYGGMMLAQRLRTGFGKFSIEAVAHEYATQLRDGNYQNLMGLSLILLKQSGSSADVFPSNKTMDIN